METKKIISYHSHFELNDYEMVECELLERKLSVYDKIYYKWIPTGFIYDKEKKKLSDVSDSRTDGVTSSADSLLVRNWQDIIAIYIYEKNNF